MTIKCIAFDLDDTLWECHPIIKRAEQRFYQWLKKYYPKISDKYSEAALIDHRIAYMQSKPDFNHNLTYLRKCWIGQLATEVEYDHNIIDNAFDVFWQARNEVTFFDGTLDILQDLSKQYSLGVISNGNADVHHIGIGHLFDFALSSEVAGVAKPHQDIFHQAIGLSKYTIDETIYVGDDPKKDVVGAQQVGIKAVWFNPKQHTWQEEGQPAAEIQHLSELEDKIKAL